MRAISIEAFGDHESLQRRALPTPTPGVGEIAIRVVNAGVSRSDLAAQCGAFSQLQAPWTPGFEVAGTVEALGAEIADLRVGDRVYALARRGGGYAQTVVVPRTDVGRMPASLLFEEAAALGLDGAAAAIALDGVDGAVHVRGAATGAGHLAVQLALAAGHEVSVDVGDDEGRRFVDRFGAIAHEPIAGAYRIDALDGSDGVNLSGDADSIQATLLRDGWPQGVEQTLATAIAQKRLLPRLFKILKIGQASEAQNSLQSDAPCGKLVLSL